MVDPTNVFAMDDIKFMTGLNVEPVSSLKRAYKRQLPGITAPHARSNSPVSAGPTFTLKPQTVTAMATASLKPIS
jgi:hypothetical protein